MTPAELTLIRALIRDVRAHFDGRGISGPYGSRMSSDDQDRIKWTDRWWLK